MQEKPYPRLRVHRRKGKAGQVWTYWTYDQRARGGPEIPLGSDYAKALELYEKCEQGDFPLSSKGLNKLPKFRKQGKRRNLKSDAWDAAPNWARLMYFNAERRSTASGKKFTITPAYFLDLVAKSDGKCGVTGIVFETSPMSPFSASLDRINSTLGYEPGNVRLICLVLNIAMNTWGFDPVLVLAKHLVAETPKS